MTMIYSHHQVTLIYSYIQCMTTPIRLLGIVGCLGLRNKRKGWIEIEIEMSN